VTVPVAAVGETVAVNVTLADSTGVVVEAASVVVVVVACQKPLQPARNGAAANISNINAIPMERCLVFIQPPRSSNRRDG
jgi:hypothetical protein